MRKNVLVTGGLGFIGSNLVHKLVQQGYNVEVIDDLSNGHLEFLEGIKTRVIHVDLLPAYDEGNDPSGPDVLVITGDFVHDHMLARVSQGRYDTIFHMAANPRVEYSVNNPTETTEQNILKSVGLFEVSSRSNTRVVFSSSASVYGDAEVLPTTEASRKIQNSPYGLQKFVGEQFGELFARLYDLDIICLRYFNVYGPRQYGGSAYSTAICSWCDKIKTGQPLRSDGDGTQSRDLVFVGDVVNANISAAQYDGRWRGQAVNVASGEVHTNNQILEKFLARFPGTEITSSPWRPGDVMHTLASTDAAQQLLQYNPQTYLDEGLRLTWEWWNI